MPLAEERVNVKDTQNVNVKQKEYSDTAASFQSEPSALENSLRLNDSMKLTDLTSSKKSSKLSATNAPSATKGCRYRGEVG